MNYRASGRFLVWRLSGSQKNSTTAAPQQVAARPAASSEPTEMIASALTLAQGLSKSSVQTETQVETLLNQIEGARRAFAQASGRYDSPESVLAELDAALQNARVALDALKARSDDTARTREEWAAARLKRAVDRVRRR
jgi:chromosome segregation ATPase